MNTLDKVVFELAVRRTFGSSADRVLASGVDEALQNCVQREVDQLNRDLTEERLNQDATQPDSYEAKCQAAAEAQGLIPIMAQLKAQNVPVELLQTGGFCMVLEVRISPENYILISCDEWQGNQPLYLTYFYSQEWRDLNGSSEGIRLAPPSLGADLLPVLVTLYRLNHPGKTL